MNSSELRAAISRQINQATGAVGDEISASRGNMFDAYMAQPYGDEVEDRSAVVDTSIADTVEWIMPELMEIFTAGDKICSFEPVGPEDEGAAEQETDVVNHVFYEKNDGFMVLYNFLKDGLIQKNGYIKRYWHEAEKVSTEEYEGLAPEEFAAMMDRWTRQGWEVEILELEMETEGAASEEGMMAPEAATISVEVKLTRTEEREVVVSVPPEEMLVSPRWNQINLDDCPFLAHRRVMTVSELVEMGYDKEQVMSLPDAGNDELSDEYEDRFSVRNNSEYDDNEAVDASTREVRVHECYLFVDYDGDGKAERRRVMVGGNGYEILKKDGEEDNEEVEVQPFSAWTPVPIPHRHYGRGVAELVSDLQRIKTVLMRQMLDNVYLTNNPTREIAEPGMGETTLSDILHERPGKVVRTAMIGNYMEHSPPQFMGQMLPALQYVDDVRENRTGVTKYNQGLDSNSLNKTATGVQKIMSASMKKLAMYARICAETGLKHLFMGIHGDLRRNASKGLTIRLRNQYVSVDPRSWADRADMTVSVGLGTADREIKMAYLTQIITEQKQHLMNGSPLATLGNLYNSYERFIVAAGYKNPDEFFQNPAKNPEAGQLPQQQGGDGQAQAYLQAEQMKVQQRAQSDQQKLMAEMMKSRMEDDRKRDEMNMKLLTELVTLNAKLGAQANVEQMKATTQAASQAFNQPPQGSQ